jgi:hypothetical protein
VGQLWYAGMSGWVTEYLISRLVHKDMMHKTSDLAQVPRCSSSLEFLLPFFFYASTFSAH